MGEKQAVNERDKSGAGGAAEAEKLRVVFCGTPEFAVPTFAALVDAPGIAVEAVVTQPDRPKGREQEMVSPAVKEAALGAGIRVYQPEKVKSDSAYEFFKQMAPDVVVILAYGQIIPQRLIDVPRLGWINLHASLLPKYRGAAPIHWAIMNGETRTGLTTMQIDAGLDTGPILLQTEMEIGEDETAPELAERMAKAGGPLVVETLGKLARREIVPVMQDESQASVAPILDKEYGLVMWVDTAQSIYNRMRGLTPWPGTFTTFREQTCQVWGRPAREIRGEGRPGTIVAKNKQMLVACGEETWMRMETVQMEGKKQMTAMEFANGARLVDGERFGG